MTQLKESPKAQSKCQVLKGGPACGHGESETDFIERVDLGKKGKLTYYFTDGRVNKLTREQSMMVLPLITQGWCNLYVETNGSKDIASITFDGELATFEEVKAIADEFSRRKAASQNNKKFPKNFTAKNLIESQSLNGCSGFVKDDFAKLCEPVQRAPFLYTGVVPKIEQRLQIQFDFPDGSWCRLSGEVIWVGELPTISEQDASHGYFWCDCHASC